MKKIKNRFYKAKNKFKQQKNAYFGIDEYGTYSADTDSSIYKAQITLIESGFKKISKNIIENPQLMSFFKKLKKEQKRYRIKKSIRKKLEKKYF